VLICRCESRAVIYLVCCINIFMVFRKPELLSYYVSKIFALTVFRIFTSIAMLLSFSLDAQVIKKFAVTPYTDPEGTRVQANCKSEGAANVIFFSKIDDIRFEGEIYEQRYNSEKQKYTLCVKAGVEITIRITHRDFAPITKVVKVTRPGDVLYYIINSDEPLLLPSKVSNSKEIISRSEFVVKSIPSDATIRMEGIPSFNERTPFTFRGYLAKTYRLKLEKDGYKAADVVIDIDVNKSSEKLVTLVPRTGWLSINAGNSATVDASVNVDGKIAGKVPLNKLSLHVGDHDVVVQKIGLSTVKREITIKENEETKLGISLSGSKVVKITTNPPNADVYVNSSYIGKSPLTCPLKIGENYLSVDKKGYAVSYRTIYLSEMSTESRVADFQLSKIKRRRVYGGPENAIVSMVFPGLGDYFVQKASKTSRKKSYIIPLAYYVFAIGAYSSYVGYLNYYQEYHLAKTQPAIEQSYQDANSQFKSFQLYAGLAATAWTIDVIRVAVRGNENRKQQLKRYSLRDLETNYYVFSGVNGCQVGLIHNF